MSIRLRWARPRTSIDARITVSTGAVYSVWPRAIWDGMIWPLQILAVQQDTVATHTIWALGVPQRPHLSQPELCCFSWNWKNRRFELHSRGRTKGPELWKSPD